MPPKDTNLSELQGMPEIPKLLTGSNALREGADAVNQLRMNEYNNKYNYWLWQQQAEYNNPSNQVARLKSAGLNPNFNSVDGTGNLGSMPLSSGSISPSIGRNRAAAVGNIISGFNALIGAASEGVDALSKLKDIPQLIALKQYRGLLSKTAYQNLQGKEYENAMRMINLLFSAQGAGFDTSGYKGFNIWFGDNTGGKQVFMPYDPSSSVKLNTMQQKLDNLGVDFDIKELVKAAKDYYNKNIQPNEAAKSQGAAGMAALGRFIQKIDNGESMSWRDWIAFILAAASMRFL